MSIRLGLSYHKKFGTMLYVYYYIFVVSGFDSILASSGIVWVGLMTYRPLWFI